MRLPARPGALQVWPGALQVWRADLGAADAELEDLLCAEERLRAARIVRPPARTRWTRARGLLRMILARHLGRDPRELRFAAGPHGKPVLAGAEEARFNLSHSGRLMLVAVTRGLEVGVDVECVRARRPPELLRPWTLREAVGKCLGTGLAAAPAGATTARAASAGLWTAELDLGPGAVAAVAVATAQLTAPVADGGATVP